MNQINPIAVAVLKDNILHYLIEHREYMIEIDVLRKDLRLMTTSKAVVTASIEEIYNQGYIKFNLLKDSIGINDKGEKFFAEGGFIAIANQIQEEQELSREKTKLEIQNLRLTRWLSILAILVSIAALVVSIVD